MQQTFCWAKMTLRTDSFRRIGPFTKVPWPTHGYIDAIHVRITCFDTVVRYACSHTVSGLSVREPARRSLQLRHNTPDLCLAHKHRMHRGHPEVASKLCRVEKAVSYESDRVAACRRRVDRRKNVCDLRAKCSRSEPPPLGSILVQANTAGHHSLLRPDSPCTRSQKALGMRSCWQLTTPPG